MDPTLYNAAISGDISVLRDNNEGRSLKHVKTKIGNTVLHLASQFGKDECVKCILKMHPSLIYHANSRGETALHLAARSGHHQVIAALVDYVKRGVVAEETGIEIGIAPGATMNANSSGQAAFQRLWRACFYVAAQNSYFMNAHINVMHSIREERETSNGGVGSLEVMLQTMNKEGNTALHEASQYNCPEAVRLLTRGHPHHSHLRNKAGETPLYLAAIRGHSTVVHEILRSCDSPSSAGPHGTTALHAAVTSNYPEIVRKLLDWKIKLAQRRDMNSYIPIHYGALMGFLDVVKEILLVDASAAYIGDVNDNTSLHLAASHGHIVLMKEIISRCPDLWDAQNIKQQNVLHIAVRKGQSLTVEYILQSCPENIISSLINQKDFGGNAPLHLIAASCCLMPTLITHPMTNVRALNYNNSTPLDLVNSAYQPQEAKVEIIRALKQAGGNLSFENSITSDGDGDYNVTVANVTVLNKDFQYQEIQKVRKMGDTHMIVAGLVATVTFTAGLTMPGGFSTDKGSAVLRNSKVFQAFIIADTSAMALSMAAIMIYFTAASQTTTISNLKRMYALGATCNMFSIYAMLTAFLTGAYATLAPSVIAVLLAPLSFILFSFYYHYFIGRRTLSWS